MKTFLIAVATVGAALTFSSPAESKVAFGKLVPAGCQNPGPAASPECTPLAGVTTPGAVAFSSDGGSAYVTYPDGIAAYAVDRVSGALSFTECFDANGSPPCTQIPGIKGTLGDIEVPSDGSSVYAGGGSREVLLGFRRNESDGRLTFSSCEYSSYGAQGDLPGCPVGNFQEVRQIEVSPDGRSLYAADLGCADNTGECFAGIGVYLRDIQTSALFEASSTAPRFNGPGPFAVAGDWLFAAEPARSALSAFRRSGPAKLKYAGCLSQRKARVCRRAIRMGRPQAIVARGRTVVTAGSKRLTVLAVSKRGKFGYRACFAPGQKGKRATGGCRPLGLMNGQSVNEVKQLLLSRDGRSLYALVGSGPKALLVFKLNARKAKVAFAQCLTELPRRGCTTVPQLHGATEIDREHDSVYALGPEALVRFRTAGRG